MYQSPTQTSAHRPSGSSAAVQPSLRSRTSAAPQAAVQRATALGHRVDATGQANASRTNAPIQCVWMVDHARKRSYWKHEDGVDKPLYPPLGYQEVHHGAGQSEHGWEQHAPEGPAKDFQIALGYNDLFRVRNRARAQKNDEPVGIKWSHQAGPLGRKSTPEKKVLPEFAKATGAKMYSDWGDLNPDVFGMKEIPKAMDKASNIHFNLDGMPRDRGKKRGLTTALAANKHWTIKELNWVLHEPSRVSKTHFYRNGKRLSAEETRAFMGRENLNPAMPLPEDVALGHLDQAARLAANGEHDAAGNFRQRAAASLPTRHWTPRHHELATAVDEFAESHRLTDSQPVGAGNLYISAKSRLAAHGLV